MRRTMVAASWVALSVLAANGQTTEGPPEFEVASVKVATRPAGGRVAAILPPSITEMIGFTGGPGSKDPGRITYTGVSLKMLLVRAYRLRPYQVSGPGWLGTAWYDIVATLPPGTDNERLSLMLQKLLTERFQISLHRETKELPLYTLTVAKNGPKLKPVAPPKESEPDSVGSGGLAEIIGKRLAAGQRAARLGERGPTQSIQMDGATVTRFAETLSRTLDLPVRDLTQLEGFYAFALSWTPDTAGAMDDAPSGPSLSAAVEEQLGLKLVTGKGPVEVLVIDKALKSPIEN